MRTKLSTTLPEIEAFGREIRAASERAALATADAAIHPHSVRHEVHEHISTELLASIEELQVAEEELREQNAALLSAREETEYEQYRYRMLFEHAPHAYFVTDLAGVIRAVNHAAAQLLAQNPHFVLSRPLASYVPREVRRTFRIELNRLAALATYAAPAELEVSLQPRDGDPVTARASVVRLIDPHTGSATLLWMFHDVRPDVPVTDATRTNAVEELIGAKAALEAANQEVLARFEQEHELRLALERADSAKARFFAVLSHELRTPLQAIFGYTELLATEQSGPLTDVQREFLQRMERSQRHLLDIVNSILDFEKMVHGTPIEPELGPVPVGEVVTGLDALMQQLMSERRIAFEVRPPEPELVAIADRALVQQVLVNLLTNAAKFTPSGGNVWLEVHRASDTSVAIVVRDTGRGIPADRLDQIFEPFVQIDACDNQRGAGLGLAISRTIARRLRGELTVTSTEGKGSEFTLTLPLVPPGTRAPPLRRNRHHEVARFEIERVPGADDTDAHRA